ncbi:MAG: hypothetical protein IT384_03535 [Deltaproteobacteria bacterium]|nr:hypothetical protein [Deltaproteobacteria bacterium]
MLAVMAGDRPVVDQEAALQFIDGLVKGRGDGAVDRAEALVFSLLLGEDQPFAAHLVSLARGMADPVEVPAESHRGAGLFDRYPWFDPSSIELTARRDVEAERSSTFQLRDASGNGLEIRSTRDALPTARFIRAGKDSAGEQAEVVGGSAAAELARAILKGLRNTGALAAERDSFAEERQRINALLDRAGPTPASYALPAGFSMTGELYPQVVDQVVPTLLKDGTPLQRVASMIGPAHPGDILTEVELFTEVGRAASGTVFRSYDGSDEKGQGSVEHGPAPLNRLEASKIRDALARAEAEGYREDAFYRGMQARSLLDMLHGIAEKDQDELRTIRAGGESAIWFTVDLMKKLPIEQRLEALRAIDRSISTDFDMSLVARGMVTRAIFHLERELRAKK